jgi:hypothetical protein
MGEEMIDIIVKASMDAVTAIRGAEKNITDQKYACRRLIDASHYLNTLMHVDNYMYELIRKEYNRISDEYLELYNERVVDKNDSNK